MSRRQAGLLVAVLGLVSALAFAAGNIDPAAPYAWAENAGWLNWNATAGNVTVVTTGPGGYLTGHVWAENVGWLKLGDGTGPYLNNSPTDWGVNMDAGGNLSGYAWSETCGWVNFAPTHGQVTINTTTGAFDGYAWSENTGWLHFKNAVPPYGVRTTGFETITQGTIFCFK